MCEHKDKLLYATAILNGILNRVVCKHYHCACGINSAIFFSGIAEVDFAVASVAIKKCLRQVSKRGAYKA